MIRAVVSTNRCNDLAGGLVLKVRYLGLAAITQAVCCLLSCQKSQNLQARASVMHQQSILTFVTM